MDYDNIDHLADIPVAVQQTVPEVIEQGDKINQVVRNRIFLNHVDEFNAKHISEYITDQVMGKLTDAGRDLLGEDDDVNVDDIHRVPMTNVEKYECVGTLRYRFGQVTEDIAFTVSEAEAKTLDKEILNAGFVIYDITIDEAEIPKALNALDVIINEIETVKKVGPKTFQSYDRVYVFILLSNILTWGKTKPIDRDDPEVPFTEADYRKRKAHPNYAKQIACEREVVTKGKKYKDILKTYVLCCGIPYGFEEDELSVFFKMAWENKKLPIFLPGTNYIPLIHIRDVAKVIHSVLELKPKKQYMLVVEQIPSRSGKIMRALAASMGKGVQEMAKEEAFLYNSITQRMYDILTINLKMEPAFILDELGLEYSNDLNLIQNMNKIVMEFRFARNLIPMKVVVHGPVASGKTTVTRHIEEYYGLHYVNITTMIEDTRESLRTQIDDEIEARKLKFGKTTTAGDEEEAGGEEGEDGFEIPVDLPGLQEKLRNLETTLENNDGRLPTDLIAKYMKQFLASNICQNQGYVLDGYPKTTQQCKDLFGPELDGGHEGGEGVDDDDIVIASRTISPQFIISLVADDDYLIEIMMNYVESDKNVEEETMLKRLTTFRDNNTEDNTMLNFFDEHEIHPVNFNVMTLDSFEALFEKIHEVMGPPFGFEPTGNEQAELYECQRQADNLKAEQESLEKEMLERKALEAYEAKMEERIRILDDLQKEEEKLLAVQCEPLRHYLMMHVFPTLTAGLLEIARIKPNDPIDYLAEYLFKFNPEGKMFDPTYTKRGERIQKEPNVFKTKSKSLKKLEETCRNST